MLNHNSLWSISIAKQEEREDLDRFHRNTDFSRAKVKRSDNKFVYGELNVSFEDGRVKSFTVTRQKETAYRGGWSNDYLGDFYSLKALKAAAIEDVDTYAY